jgi:hypothetical protein
MRIDDGTDPAWGGGYGDDGLSRDGESAARAADERTAGSVEDPMGAPKIEWGVDGEAGGVDGDSGGVADFGPAPGDGSSDHVTGSGDDGGV